MLHTLDSIIELDGVKWQEAEHERDSGVEVSISNLHCSVQRQQLQLCRCYGIIKRNFVINDEEDFRLLFNGYVRPHQVWSPYLKKDIECLEKVQRRAMKVVTGLKNK